MAIDPTQQVPQIAQPVYLSQDEQRAILQSFGRGPEWFVVGGAIVPELKSTTDPIRGTIQSPTGRYTMRISNGTYNQGAVVRPGNPDEQGNRTWVPDEVPEEPPKTPAPRTAPNSIPITTTNADGSSTTRYYTFDANTGQYSLNTSIPEEQKAAPTRAVTNQPPSPPDQWVPIKDPQGNTVAMLDPKTGERQAVSAAASARNPQIVQGANGWIYSWDGKTLTTQKQGTVQPVEQQKREVIQQGYHVTQQYIGGEWVTIALGPKAEPGAPQEGDVRPNVQGGYQIQERYQGGTWIPDTSFQPVPFTPEARASAQRAAAQPIEGNTRQAVMQGYNVTQTYSGGEWVTTKVGERAVPVAPQVISTPADQPYITTIDADGNLTSVPNPAYQPKTQAEVAARVGQLQQQAIAQRDRLAQQVSGGVLTQDEAAQQFDQWWSTNVEPQKGSLEAAQRTAQQAEQRQQEEQARANFATAQTAGRQAADIYAATLPYRVGPGFGAALNQLSGAYSSGKAPPQMDLASAVTFPVPNLNAMAEQATAQALAHISPTAAAIAGGPTPSIPQMAPQFDVNQLLSRTSYAPGTTTTVSPSGQVTVTQGGGQQQPSQPDWYSQWQQRQAADAAAQAAQSTAFPPYQPSFS